MAQHVSVAPEDGLQVGSGDTGAEGGQTVRFVEFQELIHSFQRYGKGGLVSVLRGEVPHYAGPPPVGNHGGFVFLSQAEHFLKLYAPMHNSTVSSLTEGAKKLMQLYNWPGNVRELENLIQGILVLKADGAIDEEDIQMRLRGRTAEPLEAETGRVTLPDEGLSLKETVEHLEKDLIRQALKRSEGNKARAAGLLGMNRTTLVEKLKRQPVNLD